VSRRRDTDDLRACLETPARLAGPRIPAGGDSLLRVLALDVPSRHAFGLRPCHPGADDPLPDRTGVSKQALRLRRQAFVTGRRRVR
jgi:hypothetical protein